MTNWIAIGKEAVRKAVKEVLKHKNSVVINRANIQTKADLVGQKAIIDLLKKKKVNCLLYSEELKKPLRIGKGKLEVEVSIDPVDGSFLFLKGAVEHCSVGLIITKNKKIVASFVADFSSNIYWCNEKNAYFNNKKMKLAKKVVAKPMIVGYAADKKRFNKFKKLIKLKAIPYNFGGLINSAQLPLGMYDAVLEFLPVPLYEMCGAAIAIKAGATATTLKGKKLVFDPKKRQTLILARNKELHRKILGCCN